MTKLQITSDTGENVAEIIKAAISAEISRLEIGLNKTNGQIKSFEDEYNISSEEFLNSFTAEDLKGKDQEYVEWAGELKVREKILADLMSLKDIEYVAH